jgi:hypothetical protein
MIRLTRLFRSRPAAPPAVSGEAPRRNAPGMGPVPPRYLTRDDGLIVVDAEGVGILPFFGRRVWPITGQHPYPAPRPHTEGPMAGWWQHAVTRMDLPALPIVRPYTRRQAEPGEWGRDR